MSNLLSGNFPYSTYRSLDTNLTGQVIATGKSQVFSMYLSNASGSPLYVKVYDTNVTPDETFTPIATYPVFSNQSHIVNLPDGMNFNIGIAIRATVGPDDANTDSPGQYECMVVFEYLT